MLSLPSWARLSQESPSTEGRKGMFLQTKTEIHCSKKKTKTEIRSGLGRIVDYVLSTTASTSWTPE